MKKIILTALILSMGVSVFAFENDLQEISPMSVLNIDNKVVSAITFEPLMNAINNIKNNSGNSLEGIERATSRYMQTNVVASYKDFSNIISSINGKNDFLYVTMAQRLAELGFFSLSQNSIINITDYDLWNKSINTFKRIYFPTVTLSYEEEIYLAGLQTAVLYNNSAKEVIKDLEKHDKLLKKSDYANYVLAVAYFENKNYSRALNAINKAIMKSPENVNYLTFKSKIYTQSGNYKSALKIIEQIDDFNSISGYYKEYLNNDKLYILMKMSKKDKQKYYSAELLFKTGEYQKALKEAQTAISLNKKNPAPYVIIGDYYLKFGDFEKAKDSYMKAYNLKQKYVPALVGLGHYYYMKNEYSSAYEYYLRAYKYSSQNDVILTALANCLFAKNENQLAEEYLKKAIKVNPNSDIAYYLLSKITPDLKEQYLRTALSFNPMNIYAWLDLAELKISQNNFKEAKEYLFPAELINPKNSRYLMLKKYIDEKKQGGLKSSYNYFHELINLVF